MVWRSLILFRKQTPRSRFGQLLLKQTIAPQLKIKKTRRAGNKKILAMSLNGIKLKQYQHPARKFWRQPAFSNKKRSLHIGICLVNFTKETTGNKGKSAWGNWVFRPTITHAVGRGNRHYHCSFACTACKGDRTAAQHQAAGFSLSTVNDPKSCGRGLIPRCWRSWDLPKIKYGELPPIPVWRLKQTSTPRCFAKGGMENIVSGSDGSFQFPAFVETGKLLTCGCHSNNVPVQVINFIQHSMPKSNNGK